MNDSYDAITVRPVDSSIGVNISVEKAFAAYENGTPIPEIAEHFADAVEKGFRESPQVDLESLSDYEQMKSKLSMEVVSAEKNAELLESVPHERMEDMAVVYRFVLDQTDSGNGTILVTNQLLDQYGITKEQLRADAMENAPEIRPSEIRGMSEVMSELAPGMIPEVAPEDEQMFVATVPDKIHGAGVIAYPNFMEDAAQKMGGDFFVLPSSIHEVLLVKDNGQITAKELENMVKEVNATQVEPADQLTDHVYHYDSQNHIFELADKYEERQREVEHEAVTPLAYINSIEKDDSGLIGYLNKMVQFHMMNILNKDIYERIAKSAASGITEEWNQYIGMIDQQDSNYKNWIKEHFALVGQKYQQNRGEDQTINDIEKIFTVELFKLLEREVHYSMDTLHDEKGNLVIRTYMRVFDKKEQKYIEGLDQIIDSVFQIDFSDEQ